MTNRFTPRRTAPGPTGAGVVPTERRSPEPCRPPTCRRVPGCTRPIAGPSWCEILGGGAGQTPGPASTRERRAERHRVLDAIPPPRRRGLEAGGPEREPREMEWAREGAGNTARPRRTCPTRSEEIRCPPYHSSTPQGYAIPWVADDEVIECGFDDPDYGDPAEWPDWTDRWTCEEGPAIPPDAALGPFEPSEDDLADYAEWAAEVDRRWCDARPRAGPDHRRGPCRRRPGGGLMEGEAMMGFTKETAAACGRREGAAVSSVTAAGT